MTDGGSDGTGSVPMKGEGKTTRMVKDVWRTWDGVGSDPYDLTCVGSSGSAASVLYFAANDGVHGVELWRSDGTEGGTRMVKDNVAGGGGGSDVNYLTEFNGMVYYAGRGDVPNGEAGAGAGSVEGGVELWRSDGTEGGTEIVKDVRGGSGGGSQSI